MTSVFTHLAVTWLFLSLLCGAKYARADSTSVDYDTWVREGNQQHYADKTPESLMVLLPETLKDAHARSVAGDREWFEGSWALGQPEFFVQAIDTLSHDDDTALAILFSDGRSCQIVTLEISNRQKRIVPCEEGPFVTGLLSGFQGEKYDIDADGRRDLAVVHGGGAHSSVLRVYLWKGHQVQAVGTFVSDAGWHEFRDLDSNGTVEVIVANRASSDAGSGAYTKAVFEFIDSRFVKSETLTAALLEEETTSGKR